MATTSFFEKTITDKEEKSAKIELEFGCSSFYGENLMYLTINGYSVMVDEKTGREISEAMANLSTYLGYDRK